MIKSWNTTTTLSLNWYDGFALVTSTTCRDSIWCRWLLRCESSDESLEIGSYNVLEQVPLLMSVKLVSFKGTLLIKIRPPPSDHIWLCFQAMPHLEIAAEVAIGDHKINNALLGRYIVQYIKVGFHINYLVSLSLSLPSHEFPTTLIVRKYCVAPQNLEAHITLSSQSTRCVWLWWVLSFLVKLVWLAIHFRRG